MAGIYISDTNTFYEMITLIKTFNK